MSYKVFEVNRKCGFVSFVSTEEQAEALKIKMEKKTQTEWDYKVVGA